MSDKPKIQSNIVLKKLRSVFKSKYADIKEIIVSEIYNEGNVFSVEGLNEEQIKNMEVFNRSYCKKYNTDIIIQSLAVSISDNKYVRSNALNFYAKFGYTIASNNLKDKSKKFFKPFANKIYNYGTMDINNVKLQICP